MGPYKWCSLDQRWMLLPQARSTLFWVQQPPKKKKAKFAAEFHTATKTAPAAEGQTPKQILQDFGCPSLDWTAERDRFMSIAAQEKGGVDYFRVHPQMKVIFEKLTGTPADVAKSLVTLVFNTMIRTTEVRASCVPPLVCASCQPPVCLCGPCVRPVCVSCACPCLPLLVSPLCYPCPPPPPVYLLCPLRAPLFALKTVLLLALSTCRLKTKAIEN